MPEEATPTSVILALPGKAPGVALPSVSPSEADPIVIKSLSHCAQGTDPCRVPTVNYGDIPYFMQEFLHSTKLSMPISFLFLLVGHMTYQFQPLASRLTPHASRLTPHASRLTPHASRLTPHASNLYDFPPNVQLRNCSAGQPPVMLPVSMQVL